MLAYGKLFILFLFLGISTSENVLNNYEMLEENRFLNDNEAGAEFIALLIEDTSRNFANALDFVKSVFSDVSFRTCDFWLITFNSSGVSAVWEKSLENPVKFYKSLESLATQSNLESDLRSNESLSLFALLHTAQILPSNGAIVIFTNSFGNMDSNLENIAFSTVSRKNITVYAVTDNAHGLNDLLKNILEYSGGRIISVNAHLKFEDYNRNNAAPTNASLILTKKNLVNTNDISFTIDHDVTGIHISITPSVTTKGLLISPNGYRFPFSNETKSNTIRYSQGSIFENQHEFFDIHLNFSTSARPNVGNWQLKLDNPRELYNISVFAFISNIAARARIHFPDEGFGKDDIAKHLIKLGVTGNISHISDVSLLDRNGEIILGNISYDVNKKPLKYDNENADNVPSTVKNDVNIEIDNLQRSLPFYASIKGKDAEGNVFQRLSYILGRSDIYPQQIISVDVAIGSELIVASGTRAEVYFEVTNYGTDALQVFYSCSDSKYILQSLSMYRRYLEPQESTIVTLYLNTRLGTYQDEITFTVSSGSLSVHKKILVDVGSQISDQTQPNLDHKYTSDCTEVIFSQCNKGTWTIEITARDTESGLLQVNTDPKGLFIPYGYSSGTKDSVTGYFSESCCNPNLQISAIDRMNNRRTYSVNAYYARWSAGAISALVLGILLFIILVGVIVFFIRKICKKKESYDLPTYRGGGI